MSTLIRCRHHRAGWNGHSQSRSTQRLGAWVAKGRARERHSSATLAKAAKWKKGCSGMTMNASLKKNIEAWEGEGGAASSPLGTSRSP